METTLTNIFLGMQRREQQMKTVLTNTLSEIQIGAAQQAHNLTIFPLFATPDGGPNYLTLPEALRQRTLTITEISRSGSIPNLKAVNKGDKAVLGIDTEELRGAKQNRVLNTTILIAAHSELVIPVSCTERGRWAYRSHMFGDSDVVMASKLRHHHMREVHKSLKFDGRHRVDQRRVWEAIHQDHLRHKVHTQTGAMRDTYKEKASDLEKYLRVFDKQSEQCGLLVFVNGKAAGCDLLSRSAAYAQAHSKLVRSYALDALAERRQDTEEPVQDGAAQDFVAQVHHCSQKEFASVGLGTDVRLESPAMIGSALVVDETVVHLALFTGDPHDPSERMTSYRMRRNFRR